MQTTHAAEPVQLPPTDGETVAGSVPVDGRFGVSLKVPAGSVQVEATDTADGVVGIRVRALNEAAVAALHDGTVEVTRSPASADGPAGTVTVTIDQRQRWPGRGPEFGVGVRMPAGGDLRTVTASADLATTGSLGRLDATTASGVIEAPHTGGGTVTTASGDVVLRRVDGDIVVHAASADVTIGQVAGSLQARSASGDISAEQVRGDLRTESASGDVRIGRAQGPTRARTASGDVAVRELTGPTGRVTTASGDVTVGVPDGTVVWLETSTLSGDVASAFASGGGHDGGGEPEPGEATLELTIATMSGDITVVRV